ncbi:MAG: cobalt ECF transporter T component CbiQ [Desulfobacterales bacterium]
MIEETFAFGSSPMHRMDCRLKIIAAVLFSFQTALSDTFEALAAALVFGIILVALGRLSLASVLKRLLLVNGFIFFLWVVLPFTFPGEPLFSLGPFDYSLEGTLLTARITVKSNAIILALIALMGTSPLATLGYALNRLKIPDKIIYLFLITYRYIFVIEQEYKRLIRAAKVRCFEPRTNIHTYKTYAYLIGMLFVRASARADRVYQAMVCRGFNGKFHALQEFTFTGSDLMWTCAIGSGLISMGYLEWIRAALY